MAATAPTTTITDNETIDTIDTASAATTAAATPSTAVSAVVSEVSAVRLGSRPLKIIVGSTNAAKIKACEMVVNQLFPLRAHQPEKGKNSTNDGSGAAAAEGKEAKHTFVGVSVASGVSNQPKSAVETMTGAKNRASAAAQAHADADFAIGLEGGLEKVGDDWFECGWIAVLSRDGRTGIGTSARFLVSPSMVNQLLAGREMADVVDEISGLSDVRSSQGMMGMITNGHLPRDTCYAHGLIFAFGPFLSDKKWWL